MSRQFGRLRAERHHTTLVRDVQAHLEERYADPSPSLQGVSEAFSVNASCLSRIFKEETGDNFVDCVAVLRIRRAKALLSDSPLSVQEIAGRVGYNNNSLILIRAFKKIAGITPGDYRKRSRG